MSCRPAPAPPPPEAPPSGVRLSLSAQKASDEDTANFIRRRREHDSLDEGIHLVALRDHPELVDEVIHMLNKQWPKAGRKIDLEALGQQLPCHLAMISTQNQVIGHAALIAVAEHDLRDCVILESIVVSHSFRGQGYGKLLMTLIEQYCASIIGCTKTFLFTRDKINFYSAVGYQLCDPVTPLTARIAALSSEQLESLKRLGSAGGKYLWMCKTITQQSSH